jgi:hypothetical protein
VLGVRSAPIGVFEEPPPENAGALKSVNIGRSGSARFAKRLNDSADELADFIDSLNPLP